MRTQALSQEVAEPRMKINPSFHFELDLAKRFFPAFLPEAHLRSCRPMFSEPLSALSIKKIGGTSAGVRRTIRMLRRTSNEPILASDLSNQQSSEAQSIRYNQATD